ncbi:MAG: EutN/CcmL family microcompartment protein [Planctomycetales bacterium]|jgi:microcompartment protein CcmK/EutM|nr:EutN/CcmL family microcompartment protein [Planctomycetales bacterium]MBN8627854.1 EutN/CcmL family microcompartment protein [Planctomycetota bacterium]
MQLARVVGTATSTIKHPSMNGWKLLIVQMLAADGKSPDGDPVISIDSLGAGPGQTVLITSDGKGTRELMQNDNTPVRWSVMGIQDG